MAMEDLMKALMQSTSGAQQQSGGGDAMAQMLGGLLGGAQQADGQQSGGAPVGQMLGALEQIIGGQPGTGQPMNLNQGSGMNMGAMGANDPIMMLLQPVVGQLAAKANIQPQIAMVVVSIAVHYLLSAHPASGRAGALNLKSVLGQLASGGISADTLHNSGMVNDVMQATGLNQQQAVQSLDATFGALGAHVQGGTSGPRRTMK